MQNFKPKFSTNEIGPFRFYGGTVVWIGFSLVFNALFRLSLQFSNLGTYIDEWSLGYQISTYYNYLIGFTSMSFAFCYTTYVWMSKPWATHRRKTQQLRMAQVNSIWILFGTLLFSLRLLWFFAGVELSLEKDFPYVAFLIPIFIYLYCWHLIIAIYQSKKAFLISSLVLLSGGFILSCI
ncbi:MULTISPECIES: hypothetical protein [Mesonia]|mgnify:CR=1|uniref:Uncharacterized protein n=1 Tax=Mesonia oceanica TaxID=2687242 RepID=A0AC61YC65_9FLAO|nr:MULTISPECIES: hypothetical protein [Mesonia]MAN27082.1 hypothetical protein [Mesonia sp.]MAQ41970.1 hypothetical protein [Mesonia sp.]MBJ97676.1 hypothetical protein [Flavobacteriaceae bacterium]VVV02069.1 hypothetical protein FVB9532_03365 [Mesonia oceanica]